MWVPARSVGCDAAFAPTDEVMYPKEPKYLTYVTIEGSDSVSEGAARPGFFRGVATVVTKLFNIVQVVFTTVEHSTYFIKVRHTYYF